MRWEVVLVPVLWASDSADEPASQTTLASQLGARKARTERAYFGHSRWWLGRLCKQINRCVPFSLRYPPFHLPVVEKCKN